MGLPRLIDMRQIGTTMKDVIASKRYSAEDRGEFICVVYELEKRAGPVDG
jgi:hypothetical protein